MDVEIESGIVVLFELSGEGDAHRESGEDVGIDPEWQVFDAR